MLQVPTVPPVVELDGLRLRPIRSQDAEAWYAYLSNPVVTELTSYDIRALADVERGIITIQRRQAEGMCCRWAVASASDDRMIGACGFNEWSLAHGWAELAYELAPQYWGQGIIGRAVDTALAWAFDTIGFHRVHAYVMVGNSRSTRVLERRGFAREGCLRSFRICRGEPRDFWLYGLLRPEWGGAERAGVR